MAKFLNMANKTRVAATLGGDGRRGGKRQLDAWVPGTAGNTTSTVEISISCRNLLNKDLLSKSDPLCVVYNRPPGSKGWVPFKRTEVIDDDLNPDFVTKVVMEYRFEQVQSLRFEVYDIDSHTAKLAKQDILGFVETNLGQIVSAGEEGMTLELASTGHVVITNTNQVRREPQLIILIAEELASEKDEILLKIAGYSCGNWSGCLPPRSYFSMSKLNDAGKWIVVFRSKIARGSNPTYPPMKLSCRTLCNGDLDRELKIDIFQRKFSGKLSSVGCLNITVNKLLKAGQERNPLFTPNGQSSKSALRILSCAMTPINTFLDYVQSGTQIQCCFAIDFTCSNGDPTDPQSLHYISNISSQPNPYEQAIQAVGNILKEYDSNQLFPAYGFGARIPPKGEISHNFFVTLTKSPNCCSVPGVLEAYRSCMSKIQIYGPTNFAPAINAVAKIAAKIKLGEAYYVLIIITDGVITDMAKTKKAIVEAAALPMSIIIIGVGEADFDAMEELDGDATRIQYKRKKAERDIVQFVAYRSARSWMSSTGEATVTEISLPMADLMDLEGEGSPSITAPATTNETDTTPKFQNVTEDRNEKNNRLAQTQLAAEVLAEIPEQLTSYMKNKNILPNMVTKRPGAGAKPAGDKAAEGAAPTEAAV